MNGVGPISPANIPDPNLNYSTDAVGSSTVAGTSQTPTMIASNSIRYTASQPSNTARETFEATGSAASGWTAVRDAFYFILNILTLGIFNYVRSASKPKSSPTLVAESPTATSGNLYVAIPKPEASPVGARPVDLEALKSPELRRSPYSDTILEATKFACELFDVDCALALGVMEKESTFRTDIITGKKRSSAGAIGAMQLMADTIAKRTKELRTLGNDVVDNALTRGASDLWRNIITGVAHLKVYLDMFDGDEEKAVAAYNAGETPVIKHNGVPPYKETRAFVTKVFEYRSKHQDLAAALMDRS